MRFDGLQRYTLVGGLKIRVAEAGDRSKPAVLLIHGLGGSIESWMNNLIPLSERLHVIALDLPGFGFSDKPLITYTPRYYSDFISTFVNSMNYQKVSLVGHSMGGLIALETALSSPEIIDRLVLVDVAGIGDEAAEIIERSMGEDWTLDKLIKFYEDFIVGEHRIVDEDLLKRSLKLYHEDPRLRHAYRCCLKFLGARRDMERFSEVAHPTLIVWGSMDRLVPPEYGYRLHRVLKNSKLMIFKGAGHSPHVEVPERFNSAIIDFIPST
ncbi:MAG: hypothetical protein DRJ36_04105 [Thermoprotei archaeon]|nr:MAG: hypothetical protein DRJ36_04105 [Thermoprotei archaeon]